MLLFIVSREFNNVGYDQYISFVCIAENPTKAREMKPWEVSGSFDPKEVLATYHPEEKEWCGSNEELTVHCLGHADNALLRGVVHTSYLHA